MKYYKFNEKMLEKNDCISYYFVDEADTIEQYYKMFVNYYNEGWDNAPVPLYITHPYFNSRKIYTLCIDFDDETRPFFYILSEHQLLRMLLDNSIVKWNCERGCIS